MNNTFCYTWFYMCQQTFAVSGNVSVPEQIIKRAIIELFFIPAKFHLRIDCVQVNLYFGYTYESKKFCGPETDIFK